MPAHPFQSRAVPDLAMAQHRLDAADESHDSAGATQKSQKGKNIHDSLFWSCQKQAHAEMHMLPQLAGATIGREQWRVCQEYWTAGEQKEITVVNCVKKCLKSLCYINSTAGAR
jgi:hypothetical protein